MARSVDRSYRLPLTPDPPPPRKDDCNDPPLLDDELKPRPPLDGILKLLPPPPLLDGRLKLLPLPLLDGILKLLPPPLLDGILKFLPLLWFDGMLKFLVLFVETRKLRLVIGAVLKLLPLEVGRLTSLEMLPIPMLPLLDLDGMPLLSAEPRFEVWLLREPMTASRPRNVEKSRLVLVAWKLPERNPMDCLPWFLPELMKSWSKVRP